MASLMISDPEFLDALCREKFDAFAQKAFTITEPGVSFEWNWHLECIAEHLEALLRGEIMRLMFLMPPRTLKSFECSSAFPAWAMGKHPHLKFIDTSYGLQVVEQNARKCRKIIQSNWYQNAFKEMRVSPLLDRIMHFETTVGGQYYAATALSPVTGIGCDILVMDDLIKPMEAVSEVVRSSTNANMRTTLLNRFNDRRTGKALLVQQRVHEDDPAGNLMRDGGWTVVKLPAEAKQPVKIVLNDKSWEMKQGDLLFPARLSREILDQILIDVLEYNYVGQFLQEPVPLGGGDFKDEWPQYYAQGGVKPKEMNIVILVDPSGGEELNKKKKKLSDWSAFMVVGLAPDNNRYLLDIIRDRLNPTERVDTLFMLHRKWNSLSGKSPKVGYEKYGMMTDTHYIKQKMTNDAYNFSLVELGGTQSKEERIRRLIPDLQNGRWFFPQSLIYVDAEGRRFDLVQELVKSEMASFPRARFDDMLDGLSRIYEPELNMVFPKQKIGTVAKARQKASEPINSSWEDY